MKLLKYLALVTKPLHPAPPLLILGQLTTMELFLEVFIFPKVLLMKYIFPAHTNA